MGHAAAESAFKRELLFSRDALRQKRCLKWISCFLSDYYPYHLPGSIVLLPFRSYLGLENNSEEASFRSLIRVFMLANEQPLIFRTETTEIGHFLSETLILLFIRSYRIVGILTFAWNLKIIRTNVLLKHNSGIYRSE